MKQSRWRRSASRLAVEQDLGWLWFLIKEMMEGIRSRRVWKSVCVSLSSSAMIRDGRG
ncbi:hypothetical protein Dimus_018655, partial [Dionaea muscipula]